MTYTLGQALGLLGLVVAESAVLVGGIEIMKGSISEYRSQMNEYIFEKNILNYTCFLN